MYYDLARDWPLLTQLNGTRCTRRDWVIKAVDDAVATIKTNPHLYQKVHGEFRRAALRGFPYNLIYRPADHEIIILTCVHNKRDPRRLHELS